ncbi:transcriptional activator hac1 [Colletotrichum kahawae]|uniref:Transcriptional activator hac1 n=1 Tax=Colletotrichum kahawae TaxID=34407 RepID=A0AAD9YJW8_COLKA|nr:transcriptional activator hac1 [Colletotrichum kahawae]
MAAWEQTSPMIKFEDSPAESFVSTPGELYPSLFGDAASLAADDTTVNPSDMLTPPPFTEDNAASTPDADSPSNEKKPVKKRKSWGQVLPEPKTNLPPRKRAKTEDEKEQRRVERVLRNRRAAQSSRERKRLEVEALERRNKELETALSNVTKANQLLVEELNKFRRDSGMLTRSSSPLDPLRSNSVTLSPELFGSHDGHRPAIDDTKSLVDDLMTTSHSNPTVNPASLSPELPPIAENDEADAEDNEVAETNEKSSDLTQRPAAMLCDLQCQQSEDLPQSWLASQTPLHPTLVFFLQLQMLSITSSVILSVCRRPLTQIAMSLKAGFSLPPTPSIMDTIIWLVTLPPSSRTPSTSLSSSTMRSTAVSQTRTRLSAQPSQRTRTTAATLPILRLKSLQRILTCSPTLARPLMDATMEALRLVSEGYEERVGGLSTEPSVGRDSGRTSRTWLNGAPLPSREVLMTLSWALKVEERNLVRKGLLEPQDIPNSRNRTLTSASTFGFTVSSKRRCDEADVAGFGKRCRLA